MPRFVLEIGTEEIPPRYFPVALPYLAEAGKAMLDRARLAPGEDDEQRLEVKVYGTPRRLVFIAENMAGVQAPAVREERGPSAKVAFDSQGNPTKAAEGFARRWGITPDKLVRKQTEQGEYVFAIIQEPELPAAEALAPLLPALITSIPFPKTMRWGSGSLRFGRPIRWLLALVDDEVVEFEIEGISSGRLTRGHPVLAEGMYEVAHAARYEEELEGHKVIVGHVNRQQVIWKQLDELAQSRKARLVGTRHSLDVHPDPIFAEATARQMAADLSMQTAFLVEWPTAALGQFDETFLALPRPVLIAEMEHVQSYFPLEDENGNLLPTFVAVRDGGEDHLDTVVAGWESVLRAKLIDASYFYEQDLKTPLAERVEALKGVVFQEKLGTMYEKMERVRAVAADLADQLKLSDEDREALDSAAMLCKADLTTEMVAELSDLQGIMGGVYALRSGEAAAVAEAIGEHYRPRFAGDEVPASRVGRLLAIADKLDTIAACLTAGVVPTGSADPLGLRREASGVVNMVLQGSLHVSVGRLVHTCLESLRKQVNEARAQEVVVAEVAEFLRQRLETRLRGDPPYGDAVRYDLVEAALAVGIDDMRTAADRAWALNDLVAVRPDPGFPPTVEAATRVINISRDFDGADVPVVEELLREPAERALCKAYEGTLGAIPTVTAAAGAGAYVEFFTALKALRDPIDRFFDEVLVMHEDEKIRRNRLALCWNINHNLFRRLADFSLIVQT